MKRNILLTCALLAVFTFSACKDKKTTDSGKELIIEKTGVAVCIWDNLSLRETPANDSKWLASVSLGEKCKYLREEKEVTVGEKTTKFIKIELQDGKQGWVQSDFMVVDGKPGVIIQDAVIYSRPDLLTKTGKSFSKMDIVGIKGEQNEFVEISGKRKDGKWIETGWIKPSNISFSDIDIAVAKYASKALVIEDTGKKNEAINEILTNADLKGSIFIDELRNLLSTDEIVEEAVEQVVDEMNADSSGYTSE